MWFAGCTAPTANRRVRHECPGPFGPDSPGEVRERPPRLTAHANGSFAGANECSTCHPNVKGSIATGIRLSSEALHGNGIADVSVKWKANCFGCHEGHPGANRPGWASQGAFPAGSRDAT